MNATEPSRGSASAALFAEAAQVLGIQERAVAKRLFRALERLRQILAEMPGGLTELRP